ncbi:MAG: ATP-binding cassette domain-containing protein [Bacteroidetes bacterium]|jgi:ABC-2 type transport system ATP-binding protein|nr:ATP-binding cassette domain-containing protein [Bacteroidota bacterium]MBX7238920.1 ATP-binding cassette domain-containing protein [Bacteroidia bacterium]MCC7514316.1 ATP-binding cassette domain-containing protein [Bacteroidia bacterium]MCW5920342.1 ATP-binding cassette domain-containing protein [Bacteroidota bacterium]HCI57698.1 ABC transporter ATP-binding protein [Bacteroidota bacterium]
MNLLSIREVSKIYANHKALDSVSIEIPESSVFGLLGPNGAGKTSLIRIINQITGPDGGSILFGGQTLNPSHISAIGYLPEERGLYKKMEVGEQAIYLARLKGLSRADALKKLRYWFEKFEMQSWWRKKVEELSKGMQQKVQFIVTILHEPRLLILDEPFTGFDPINANLIKDELLGLRQKGTTIILSTHRMESVEELCTHIALINKSKKILDGQVKDVRKQFRSNLFEIEYKGTSVGFANALWTGFELVETRTQDDHAFAIVKNLNNSSANDLLRQLLNDVEVISFRERIPTMNDIFIESVQNNKPLEA